MKRLLSLILGFRRRRGGSTQDTSNTVTKTRRELVALWDVVNEMDATILGRRPLDRDYSSDESRKGLATNPR
jgi:hypothetical protein